MMRCSGVDWTGLSLPHGTKSATTIIHRRHVNTPEHRSIMSTNGSEIGLPMLNVQT